MYIKCKSLTTTTTCDQVEWKAHLVNVNVKERTIITIIVLSKDWEKLKLNKLSLQSVEHFKMHILCNQNHKLVNSKIRRGENGRKERKDSWKQDVVIDDTVSWFMILYCDTSTNASNDMSFKKREWTVNTTWIEFDACIRRIRLTVCSSQNTSLLVSQIQSFMLTHIHSLSFFFLLSISYTLFYWK
jgi:hypothetical protein